MINLDTYLNVPIIKIQGQESGLVEEAVIVEYNMRLVVNNEMLLKFSCTPRDLRELAAGYLFGAGIISCKDDILDLQVDEEKHLCDVTIKRQSKKEHSETIDTDLTIEIDTIYSIMNRNLTSSELFVQTAGVHSVAVFDEKKEVIIMEDVARHNAVDKALGYCVLNDISLEDKILAISGRTSGDMLMKAENAGIPMVLCKSAPTSLSIEQAKESGITLIGFVRGEKMNIYSNPARVNLGDEIFCEIAKKKRINHLERFSIYST